MILLAAIPILLAIPLLTTWMNRVGFRFGAVWSLAAAGAVAAMTAAALSLRGLPEIAPGPGWLMLSGSEAGFSIDRSSWPLAFSLTVVSLSALLTLLPDREVIDRSAIGFLLVFSGVGLAAILSISLPFMVVAWTALDLLQILFVLRSNPEGGVDRRVVVFAGRNISASLVVLFAVALSGPADWTLLQVPEAAVGWLILGAGIRLGVLPLQPPLLPEDLSNIGAGAVRSIGAASTWIILARAAQIPIGESWVVPLQVLALTAGLIAVAKWLTSQAYGEAGSFWRYGFAALAVHAAVIGLPEAVVGYGVVYFLGGSLLGFSSISRTRPRWMLAGAALLIAGLPLTPSWAVSAGFELSFWPAGLFAMVITAGFIDGYIRYSFARLGEAEVVESGIGALTFLGLVLLMVALVFIGLVPVVSGGLPHGSWWAGFLVAALVGLMMAFRRRALPAPHISLHFLERVFSFTWLYRSLWRGFQAAGRGFRLMSSLLEGEAAVLWALVMLALLVSLFSQIGFGG